MSKRDRKRHKRPEKTTMRAGLTGDESEALKDYLRRKCGGLTIDEALKQALDMWLDKGSHTNLRELASAYKERQITADGLVQETLF